jgi:hypothetical protein
MGRRSTNGQCVGMKHGRTKHFPSFPKPLPVLRVDHVHDGVAVLVVAMPYGPDAPLPTKVEKVENRRGERDLAH